MNPAVVRITVDMSESLHVCGDVEARIPEPFWWVSVKRDGKLLASYGALTLRDAIRYMRAGGLC